MNPISLVFLNGQYAEHLSDKMCLPKEIELHADEEFFLRIPKKLNCLQPIYLRFLTDSAKQNSRFKHRIQVEADASVILIEEHLDAHRTESHTKKGETELHLHKNATVHYCKLQNENQMRVHFADLHVLQNESSTLHLFLADSGSLSAQNAVRVHLQEAHAACHLLGFYYLTHDDQVLNNAIQVNHVAPFSQSNMIFKGILNKKSRAAFQGKVYVDKKGEHTLAHQTNHNLLLSNAAEIHTEPHLEIYAEDIKCTHGATVGQLNQEALFYLQTRGLTKADALKLLTEAYLADLLTHIADLTIRQYVSERVLLS